MWPLQLFVLFVVVDYVGDGLLLIKTALVDSVLGQVGFYHMQFAEMSPAVALVAEAALLIMMHEIAV